MTQKKEQSVLRKEKREWLPCKLSQAELMQFSKDLANSYERRNEIESNLETFKSQIKAQLAEVDGNIQKFSGLVSCEVEYRMIDCEILYDFKSGKRTLTRKDTGEVIRTDDITGEERQMELKV